MPARKKPAVKVKDGVAKRPAGSTAGGTSLLLLVLGWFGVELSWEEATILLGGLTSLASMIFTD